MFFVPCIAIMITHILVHQQMDTIYIESLITQACNSSTYFSSKSPSSERHNTKPHKTNTSNSRIHCVRNLNYTTEAWVSSLVSSCWGVCGENATGTGFCPGIRITKLFPINIFLPVIHTHTSLIYHRCYIILAVYIVVK
jgi:hypothetical protein